MSGILILGAGGHGKVVADILTCQGIGVLGFLDDNPATWGSSCLGLPTLGGINTYKDYAPDGLIIGVGQNRVREALVQRLGKAADALWINAIHPSTIIAPSVCLGIGIVIAAGAVINPEASIGDHTIINTGATIDHDCQIGGFCHIAPGVHLAGAVTVGEGSLLGIGSAVIPLRNIGEWTIVGAGAVVIRDVPSNVTAKGIPARWGEE